MDGPAPRVLLIDASETLLARIDDLLGAEGFRVACAASLEEALLLIVEFQPELIVS